MKKRWDILITQEMEGRKIGEILKKELGLTKKQISRMKFRKDGILLNGEKKRVTDMVRPEDCLSVQLETEQKTCGVERGEGTLAVLYEDEDILLVKKPAGMPCHPGRGHYKDSLANQAAGYLSQKGEEGVIREVGRLDRDTSGVVVFAKNRIAAARLAEQRERGRFHKEYLALVDGIFKHQEGEVRMPIGHLEGSLMKMCVREDGKEAVTRYRVVKSFDGKTLAVCTLQTGRTHQIRVHMAAIGHPILGDVLYGGEARKKAARLCLHAGRVSLYQPFTGEPIEVCWKEEFGEEAAET